MDHRPNTIEQRHSPVGRGEARSAPDRLPPELVRAAASPVRRSGAPEAAARALGQAEDEWGTARSRLDPPPGAARNDARVRAASATAPWRTPDGTPGWVGAWWITPGEAAVRRDGPGVQGCSGDRWREVLALYPGWARPTAEERA
jgi:hypothetical protein